MKTAIILPSLNEADSISNVVRMIDVGISSSFQPKDFLIINSDGPSNDGTKHAFLNTSTNTSKVYLSCGKEKVIGKGTNILTALREHISDFDAFLLIDADLTSIDESWLTTFMLPLMDNKLDFVSPVYKRNRFEGNTTNHFSAPLIKLCTHSTISQPIAGDFAFTKKVGRSILDSVQGESDYQYGIDTLISWTVGLEKFQGVEVSLDRKIHKPSFEKIVPMFSQICETTLRLVLANKREVKTSILTSNDLLNKVRPDCITEDFIRMPEEDKMRLLEHHIETERERITKNGCSSKFESYLQQGNVDENVWSSFLADLLSEILLSHNLMTDILSVTTVLYLSRVLCYFHQIEKMNAKQINELLRNQDMLILMKTQNAVSG